MASDTSWTSLRGARRSDVTPIPDGHRRRLGGWATFGEFTGQRGGQSMTEDVLAIQQLLHRYCFVVDDGTPDDVANLFHETATLVPVYSGEQPRNGRAAIREWFATFNQNVRERVD